MTPKEKAEELFDRMYEAIPAHPAGGSTEYDAARFCALIAADTAMEALRFLPYGLDYLQQIDYWEEVKQEIEKL